MSTIKQYRPPHAMREAVDHPRWMTVDTSLDRGQVVTVIDGRIDPGLPVPEGCLNEWRIISVRSDEGGDQRIIVTQARRRVS